MGKLKGNIALIIVCFFLFLTGAQVVNEFQKDFTRFEEYYEINHQKCIDTNDPVLCQHYAEPYHKLDTVTTFGYMLFVYDGTSRLQLLAPLLVIIVSVWYFHTYLRQGLFKNSMTRIGYGKFIKKYYMKTLKYSLIIPIFLLLLFIVSYFISGNFDYEYGIYKFGYSAFGYGNAQNWVLFMIVYLFNFVLRGIFWINIGVYNCKYNKSKLMTIIISYIEYIMIFLVLETGIGETIFYQTKYMYYLLLTNVWSFSNVTLLGMTCMSSILVLVSTAILYLTYRNKEKVLIEVEK